MPWAPRHGPSWGQELLSNGDRETEQAQIWVTGRLEVPRGPRSTPFPGQLNLRSVCLGSQRALEFFLRRQLPFLGVSHGLPPALEVEK